MNAPQAGLSRNQDIAVVYSHTAVLFNLADRNLAEAPDIKAEETGNSDENSVAEPAPTEQPAADTAESADTPEKEAAQAVRSAQDPAPEETGPDGE